MKKCCLNCEHYKEKSWVEGFKKFLPESKCLKMQSHFGEPLNENTLAVAQDYDSYNAFLDILKPEYFYCAMYKKKE